MALKKQTDSVKGINLVDTYNRIKYSHFDRIVVQTPVLDEEGKPTIDNDGNQVLEYSKKCMIRIVIVTYANKEDSDTDTNLLKTNTINIEEDSLVCDNSVSFLEKLYIQIKSGEYSGYTDC